MQNVVFKIGDKVVRADGLVGKIIETNPTVRIQYEDGRTEEMTENDVRYNYRRFFTIGEHVFGNKHSLKESKEEIEYWKKAIAHAKEQLAIARKCMFRVKAMHNASYPLAFALNDRVTVAEVGAGIVKDINLLQPPYPRYGILLDDTDDGKTLYYCGTEELTALSEEAKETD